MTTREIQTPTEIEDRHVRELAPLFPPAELKARYPNRSVELVERTRDEIRDVLHGRDLDRLVVIVGPCSIHDPQAALDYAYRLARLRRELEDELLVVLRAYFEKPRTTVGWKGLVYDPHLDGSEDVPTGLELSRRVLCELNGLGLPCAVEVLDPITPQYHADLVSWAAIGARTVESQVHRQLASGLSMPVGFKNATSGNVDVAVHAMTAAKGPHTFFGIDAEGRVAMVRTSGNPDTHVVLRGGGGRSNYDPDSVRDALERIEEHGLERPVMVDCSHSNSHKEPRRQAEAAASVLEQFRAGNRGIMGLMIESHLYEGRQDWSPNRRLRYGVSITDACIGWEMTEALLYQTAQAVRAAR